MAKQIKSSPELANELWASGDTAARLLSILICKPKQLGCDELDAMLREADGPKVLDWLVNYVVKKSAHKDDLLEAWFDDPDRVVASAGWALTTDLVKKESGKVDLDALLNQIEAEMQHAPDRLQWAMNTCLAEIGINHEQYRMRAIDIGERLEVLKDYPTPPNCTSPFAPIWIREIVSRQK